MKTQHVLWWRTAVLLVLCLSPVVTFAHSTPLFQPRESLEGPPPDAVIKGHLWDTTGSYTIAIQDLSARTRADGSRCTPYSGSFGLNPDPSLYEVYVSFPADWNDQTDYCNIKVWAQAVGGQVSNPGTAWNVLPGTWNRLPLFLP